MSKIEDLTNDVTMELENGVELFVEFSEDVWHRIPQECRDGITNVGEKVSFFSGIELTLTITVCDKGNMKQQCQNDITIVAEKVFLRCRAYTLLYMTRVAT